MNWLEKYGIIGGYFYTILGIYLLGACIILPAETINNPELFIKIAKTLGICAIFSFLPIGYILTAITKILHKKQNNQQNFELSFPKNTLIYITSKITILARLAYILIVILSLSKFKAFEGLIATDKFIHFTIFVLIIDLLLNIFTRKVI